jgi:Carboxypeptidase regulatory-like domain/TonB dependent receptor
MQQSAHPICCCAAVRISLAFVCFCALVLLPFAGRAQTFTGTVVGRILDFKHAAVPNASITLRNAEKDFERRTIANERGEYNFDLLPPGTYRLVAESTGFAASDLRVEVVVASSVRADVVLQIRPVREEVKVVGEGGVSVQTENANLGGIVSLHEMTELPTLGRSLYDFVALIPGATFSNDDLGVGFAVNGARTQSANYLLDGAENNDIMMSAPAMDVPLDSIQEFNVQTNHFSAEYGRNSGFTANIVTKNGTNTFHGSFYDYLRNSALAANTSDNNAHGLPRAEFNRNQFGATVGGPLRKGKLFFFASEETLLVRSSGPNTFFVPTPQLLAISAPGTQAIFQRFPLPNTRSPTNVRTETLCPFGTSCDLNSGKGLVTIPAFAFTSRIGPHDFGAGPPQNTILATGRLDWMREANTQVFLRYAIEEKDEFAIAWQPYSKELDQAVYGHNQNVSINLIHSWSAKFATESRLAYDRVTGDPERFGGEAYPVPKPAIPSFAILNEPVSLPGGSSAEFGPIDGYQFFQTATWSHGSHLLRFGGQFLHLRQNLTFGVAGQIADAQFANSQGFVNGLLQLYSIAIDPKGHYPGEFVDPPYGPPSFTRHYHYNEPALFIADTWKVNPRLTLTPGLRWEYFGVLHSPGSEHVLDSNFYPEEGVSWLAAIANGKMMRTIGAPGELRGKFYLPDYRNFAPRLGLAYDIFGDGKTVFRAGGGLFYDRKVGWEFFRALQNPPAYSFARLHDVVLTPELVSNQYAAFPNSPVQLSTSTIQASDLHLRSAYASSWNATLEREFAKTVVASASYLGSSGSRLYSLNNVNRAGSGGLLNPSCVSTRIAADGITPIGPDYSECPRLNSSLGNITMRQNAGHSSYHALQVRVDSQRLSRAGLQFGGNYTWSHSIDNRSVSGLSNSVAETGVGYLDAFHPELDHGSSDYDARHRVAAHFIWEIPLLGKWQAWQRHAMQGWELSSFFSYQSGQPFSLADFGTPDLTVERTRPQLTGTRPRSTFLADALSPNNYLFLPMNRIYDPVSGLCIADAAPFACEVSVNGPFRNILPRSAFRQPGLFFLNTALIKNFGLLHEKARLQLRAEFYNLFNHSNLYVNGPSTDASTNSFTAADGVLVPGVTVSFRDNRQIVLACKLIF